LLGFSVAYASGSLFFLIDEVLTMSHSIQCPHCQAVLKSPTPVPPGKNVKCPQCKQFFATGEPRKEAAPAPVAPVSNDLFNEDDEMAAAIAKLEADQSAGTPPAPVPAKPAPAAAPKQDELVVTEDELIEPEEEEKPIQQKPVKKEPPPAKKKREDDDEDEKPRPKNKRYDEDEASSEKPRSRSKKTDPDDENEDEDDEPRSKKNRRDDDEDDEPRSRKKKKKKAGGSAMLLTFLLGGGVLGLLACCGCGIGSYFFFFANPMAGKWESDLGNFGKIRWDFGYFGSGNAKFTFVHPLNGQTESATAFFDYSFTRGDPATLELKVTKVEGKNNDLLNAREEKSQRFNVTFRDGNPVLTRPDRLFGDAGLVLRRPK
jgi:hypothetical protein